jgi:tetratricopeptide (TPR) repeat protein
VKRRLLIGGAVAALAAAASLLGGGFRGDASPAAGAGAAPAVAGDRLSGGFSAGDTATLVARLQSKLRANPADGGAAALLGLAYQQRARETGDPAYYSKSAAALGDAIRLDPQDLTAIGGLGSLALARHRFRDALALGRRAVRLSPSTARSHGVVGDALVELGRYREAFASFDTMARLKPSLASYARVSYARELLGRQAGAEQAMRMALDAAIGQPEPEAWTRVQLGKLFWSRGDLPAAAAQYRGALLVFPGYVYGLDALAQVEGARGNVRRAIALEQRAVDTTPLPQFVAFLGDLYAANGNRALAQRQYGLIGAIERLLRANGVQTDLETALFDVDHGVRLGGALRLARLAHAERPSIDGDDVLAWALARNGRCGEAQGWSTRSLRLGTQDALKFFHRGWIERCLGNRAGARTWFGRALARNPHFSIRWTPVAREALR